MRHVVLAFLCACGSATIAPDDPPSPIEQASHDSTSRIDDEAGWERLAARPLNHHVARTEVVKFVIDRGDGDRTYFLASSRFESHFDFVDTHISPGTYGNGMDFYRREYRNADRRFILGSIVRYVDAGVWAIELISGDDLAGERLVWAIDRLSRDLYFGDRLQYRPTSDLHVQQIAGVRDRLTIADDAQLFGAMRYQPVQLGVAYGTLRLVRGAVPRGQLSPRDVLVTDEVPDDLPLVAALITSRFQAPLAHVAVLSTNRNTPDMALRGAIDDPAITALEGTLVRVAVGAQEYAIEPASMAEAQSHWATRAPHEPFSPAVNMTRSELIDQCALSFADVEVAGAKASQMGELCRLSGSGVRVPSGFVVPFAHYAAHLTRNRLDAQVRTFLEGPDRANDPTAALAAMRQAILRAPADRAVVRAVRERLRQMAPTGRVRFRSSTNAEDLPGFTGAGLYSSSALSRDATEAEVATALREIWASVWNLGAFQEREHYRIDHARVAMAVLVQTSVDDSIGNGVAITANPYDELRPGVLINVQRRGASVTGAHGDQIPEQWLVFTYLPDREPELITRSSLENGEPIMRREEVLELTRQLEAVHTMFTPRFGSASNAVDVEFLVAGPERMPVLVQARPLRVAWQGRESIAPQRN
jgi:hypothetical protein